jgi:hypothetical protein
MVETKDFRHLTIIPLLVTMEEGKIKLINKGKELIPCPKSMMI